MRAIHSNGACRHLLRHEYQNFRHISTMITIYLSGNRNISKCPSTVYNNIGNRVEAKLNQIESKRIKLQNGIKKTGKFFSRDGKLLENTRTNNVSLNRIA